MQASTAESACVLVVDDRPELAELFAARLRDGDDVRTAHDGRAARRAFDPSAGVVVPGREVPDVSGERRPATRERYAPAPRTAVPEARGSRAELPAVGAYR